MSGPNPPKVGCAFISAIDLLHGSDGEPDAVNILNLDLPNRHMVRPIIAITNATSQDNSKQLITGSLHIHNYESGYQHHDHDYDSEISRASFTSKSEVSIIDLTNKVVEVLGRLESALKACEEKSERCKVNPVCSIHCMRARCLSIQECLGEIIDTLRREDGRLNTQCTALLNVTKCRTQLCLSGKSFLSAIRHLSGFGLTDIETIGKNEFAERIARPWGTILEGIFNTQSEILRSILKHLLQSLVITCFSYHETLVAQLTNYNPH